MHDLLYREQERLDPLGLSEKAQRAELNQVAFKACLDSGAVLSQIRLDAGEGLTLGVSSTPTLFFGMVEEADRVRVVRRVGGAQTFGKFEEIVDGLLRQAGTARH